MSARSAAALLMTAGAAPLLLGAAPASSAGGTAARVTLEHVAFSPATVRIHPGSRVTFVWRDGPYVAHDVHAVGSPRFRGASARRTGTYLVRFTRRGTYRYACSLHPGMSGRVVVR